MTASLQRADEQRATLVSAIDRINNLGQRLESSRLTELTELADRVKSDAFRVMVMGDFKQGKSTLVNALLGSDVLPVASSPATAVVTEVFYAEQPSVTLWPVDTAAPAEEVPFDQLSERIRVNNDDLGETSPYRLAQVGWPLPLLNNGVVVVDSPGLNEHPVRQIVTLDYLRHADAVIFVLSAIQAFSNTEKQFLDANLDSHDLFIVVNRINQIDEHERDEVRRDIGTRVKTARPEQNDRFFFVNAKAGVRAQVEGLPEIWSASGLADFNSALADFLVNERHRAKILVPARDAKRILADIRHRVPEQLAMLEADAAALEQRYAEAQQPLADLDARAQRIERSLQGAIDDLGEHVRQQVRSFLGDLARRVPTIVNEVATDQRISMKPWATKRSTEQFGIDIAEKAAETSAEEFRSWNASTLSPDLAGRIENLASDFDDRMSQYFKDVRDVRETVTGVSANLEERPEAFTEILTAFTTDGIATIDGANAKAGLTLALKQLMVAVTLGMAWALTPFGLVPLILAAAASAFLGLDAPEKIGAKVRQAVADELTNELRARSADDADAASASFRKELAPVLHSVSTAIQGETDELHRQVSAALSAKQEGADHVRSERDRIHQAMQDLDETSHLLDELIHDVALGL